MTLEPLERHEFDAAALIRQHPPRWHHPNKQAVFEVAAGSGIPFEGAITVARWLEEPLTAAVPGQSAFTVRPGFFEYLSAPPGVVPWHVNFADPELFVAYGSPLLAQDELQVAEHPVLGSVREALVAAGNRPRTVDSRGRATPFTLTGVQRRCAVDTRPDHAAGRPGGLYGNAFAGAPVEQVIAATTPLRPPTVSHILAMAAPAGGFGAYGRAEIRSIVATAYTGFQAARGETERLGVPGGRTMIHTGFWGCGAFGGNRTLMTMLQALAADLAEVDLVFHAAGTTGVAVAEDAHDRYARTRDSCRSIADIVDEIAHQGFAWGVSNGT